MTRFDYRCASCGLIQEIQAHLGEKSPLVVCACGVQMTRYYGRMSGEDISINYGYREHRYNNETDSNIAKFQFTNL